MWSQYRTLEVNARAENIIFFDGGGGGGGGGKALPTVKIADFGFSQRYTAGAQLHTTCGSLCYSAPEILLGEAYDPPCVGTHSYMYARTHVHTRTFTHTQSH